MHVAGAGRVVSLEDDALFERLPREHGVRAPQCDRLVQEWYGNPTIDVAAWRDELAAIRDAYQARRREALIRERGIRARDPATLEAILGPMLAGDPTLATLVDLIVLCDAALIAGEPLTFAGD